MGLSTNGLIRRQFHLIFWGLLLVVLNFTLTINSFAIHFFPDVIGYALIAIGCKRLEILSRRFVIASSLSWAMSVLSLVAFAIDENTAIWNGLVTSLRCLIVWYMLGGVIDFGNANQQSTLVSRGTLLRAIYCALMLANLLVARYLGPLGLGLAIAELVAVLLVLHFLWTIDPSRFERSTSDDILAQDELGQTAP